ncbi:hypothetical protein J7L87_01980, partial [bacterium]|nr:hypothetical protein [bacterium]
FPERVSDGLLLIESFKKLCGKIEKVIGKENNWENLRNTIVITDLLSSELKEINLLSTGKEVYKILLGMLILAFPEVCFLPLDKFSKEYNYNLLKISPPIFDPEGNRNKVKEKIKELVKTFVYFPREKISYSIDEEKKYAYLSGYTAYKAYYRDYLITTKTHMDFLLKEQKGENGDIVFEDIFINFVDRPTGEEGNLHFSDLEERYDTYPRLKKIKKHIYLTVGHENIPRKPFIKNKKYFNKWKKFILYKPIGGIYNILIKSGLWKEYRERRKRIERELEKNIKKLRNLKEFPEEGGHSAPGRILAVVNVLLERAERIFETSDEVEDCIHGATLALEAQELLNYKTPTTSIEAIALRNKLEVKAECLFYGVTHRIEVKKRIEEIKQDINLTAKWFNPKVKTLSIYNALINIVNEITGIFAKYGQFDEEMVCRKYLRDFIRRENLVSLKTSGKYLFLILNIIFYPIRFYVELLVSSLNLFIFALIGWPIFFTMLVKILYNTHGVIIFPEKLYSSTAQIFIRVFVPFMGFEPLWNYTENMCVYQQIFIILLAIFGFMHLGIFISHLYTLITRR